MRFLIIWSLQIIFKFSPSNISLISKWWLPDLGWLLGPSLPCPNGILCWLYVFFSCLSCCSSLNFLLLSSRLGDLTRRSGDGCRELPSVMLDSDWLDVGAVVVGAAAGAFVVLLAALSWNTMQIYRVASKACILIYTQSLLHKCLFISSPSSVKKIVSTICRFCISCLQVLMSKWWNKLTADCVHASSVNKVQEQNRQVSRKGGLHLK